MYIPRHFEVGDREKKLAFIHANSFGQLISNVTGRLFVSHIPFHLSHDGSSLLCHLAKANPQWQEIENQEVLVTFQGPHGYISPSWYESLGMPTWNYQVVHVYGSAKIMSETDALKHMLDELTETHESSLTAPWKPEYKASLLKAIVAIEIKIDEIQGKDKLSQNRSVNDRKQVVDELEKSGSTRLAKAMAKE